MPDLGKLGHKDRVGQQMQPSQLLEDPTLYNILIHPEVR